MIYKGSGHITPCPPQYQLVARIRLVVLLAHPTQFSHYLLMAFIKTHYNIQFILFKCAIKTTWLSQQKSTFTIMGRGRGWLLWALVLTMKKAKPQHTNFYLYHSTVPGKYISQSEPRKTVVYIEYNPMQVEVGQLTKGLKAK